MKKIPQRMCVVTREKTDKRNLLRIVRTKEGNVVTDETGKLNGKGAYITKDKEVLEKAIKTKELQKALEVEIPNELYEEILKKL